MEESHGKTQGIIQLKLYHVSVNLTLFGLFEICWEDIRRFFFAGYLPNG